MSQIPKRRRIATILATALLFAAGCGTSDRLAEDAQVDPASVQIQPNDSTPDSVEQASSTSVPPASTDSSTQSPDQQPQVDQQTESLIDAQACRDKVLESWEEGITCLEAIRSSAAAPSAERLDELRQLCASGSTFDCYELVVFADTDNDLLLAYSCIVDDPSITCGAETALVEETDPPEETLPAPDLAAELTQFLGGQWAYVTYKDLNRPIYGWIDVAEVSYCIDGTVEWKETGQRKTVLDNLEERSYYGLGNWSVIQDPSGALVIQHFFADGGAQFVALNPTTLLPLADGVTMQFNGPGRC